MGISEHKAGRLLAEMCVTDQLSVAFTFIPPKWPLPSERCIFGTPANDRECAVYALPSGKLKASIFTSAGQELACFVSQPLNVLGAFRACITWDASVGILVYLNGLVIASEQASDATLTVNEMFEGNEGVVPKESVFHPSAVAACATWVANRKAKFSTGTIRAGRRPKTPGEEADDLQRSAQILGVVGEQVLHGQTALIGTLAGEIRASVYWEKDTAPDRGYSPLLLRMASKADLHLPVYPPAKFGKPLNPLYSDADFGDMGEVASFMGDPRWPVCDLQEWLRSPKFHYGSGSPPVSVKQLIAETANTLGAAHYDADVSEAVTVPRNVVSGHLNILAQFLGETAVNLSALSQWVLGELKSKGAVP